jgi:hypothetical protein
MEFHGIDQFMRHLQAKFDECERRHEWRVLTGRDHIRGINDSFIFTDQKVYQIKSEEVAPRKVAAVAREVGGPSPDMLDLIKGGAPIPLSVISRSSDAYSVIMFGMQQYSSDIADLLKLEFYQSKQDELFRDLMRNVDVMLERPEYRSSHRRLKESQERYFA